MKTNLLLIFLMAFFVLSSCQKDNQKEDPNFEGKEGYLNISINALQSRSRAPEDGIDEERQINSIHVFLFNQSGTGTPTIANFDNSQFTTNGEGITTLNTPLRTSMADKYGYIGVNLTDEMVAEINGSRNNLLNAQYRANIEDLANVSGSSFVMFTDEIDVSASEIYQTQDDADANPVSATLRRLTSKAGVYYNNTVFIGDGTYEEDNVQFAWRRINQLFYYIQKTNLQDPNFGPGDLTVLDRDDTQSYLVIDPSQAGLQTFQYTTENTFDFDPATIVTDDATCVSVRVPFQPSDYTVNTGGTWGAVTNPNAPADDAPDFWVVMVNSGTAYYFSSNAIAQSFYDDVEAGNITIDGVALTNDYPNYREMRYINGWCYYNVYVNSATNAATDAQRYNVLRNTYFRLALNQLSAPGYPDWDFDTGEPIIEYGYIQFNIEIENWTLVDEAIDF